MALSDVTEMVEVCSSHRSERNAPRSCMCSRGRKDPTTVPPPPLSPQVWFPQVVSTQLVGPVLSAVNALPLPEASRHAGFVDLDDVFAILLDAWLVADARWGETLHATYQKHCRPLRTVVDPNDVRSCSARVLQQCHTTFFPRAAPGAQPVILPGMVLDSARLDELDAEIAKVVNEVCCGCRTARVTDVDLCMGLSRCVRFCVTEALCVCLCVWHCVHLHAASVCLTMLVETNVKCH